MLKVHADGYFDLPLRDFVLTEDHGVAAFDSRMKCFMKEDVSSKHELDLGDDHGVIVLYVAILVFREIVDQRPKHIRKFL
jgi:hypothetical protein